MTGANMNNRIEKKVSKKLAAIVGNSFGDVWVDKEVERYDLYYAFQNPDGVLTKRQIFENRRELGNKVNCVPSVGGELDYWGEATEIYTLWESVSNSFHFHENIHCVNCWSGEGCDSCNGRKMTPVTAINVLKWASYEAERLAHY
jgi:hypothetical protein